MALINCRGCLLGKSVPCRHAIPSRLALITRGRNSFMIGGMSTILPFGKIYIIYDSKWVFITSFVFFLAGSALCGAAPNIDAEIVGRVMAGAGEFPYSM